MAKVDFGEIMKQITFSFGGDTGIDTPNGFSELELDDEVTVIVRGKVVSLSKDKDSSRLTVSPDDISLAQPSGKTVKRILETKHGNRRQA